MMPDLTMNHIMSVTDQKSTIDWDEQNAQLARWVQTDEARQAFHDLDREIQAETDVLRERTVINHEELQKPFTI
jgi:hypothetical protein